MIDLWLPSDLWARGSRLHCTTARCVKRRAPLEYSDTVWPLPKSLYLYVVRLDNKADWSAGMELAGADQCRPNAVSSSCGLRAMVVWDSVFVTALMAVSPLLLFGRTENLLDKPEAGA